MPQTFRPSVRVGGLKARRAGTDVGGRSLGFSFASTSDALDRLKHGFPYTAIAQFHKRSGLAVARIAELIRIPQRTLMRRRATGRLRPEESERLLRISRIFEMAAELFEGDTEAARRWLITPSPEFDNQGPLHFASTEIGARAVEDVIRRLEHGVFT